MSDTTTEVLTVSDACAIADIIRWAQGCKKVARVRDDGIIINGIARAVCGPQGNGNFAGPEDDVRACFLWVTLQSGFEAFWPIRDLIPQVKEATFANYEWETA